MDHNGNGRALTRLSAPQRNNYFYGKLLDVPHLQMESNYLNRKRWLLNRLGLGKGVLCGLEVEASSDGKQLCIKPGVAIDGYGREISVPDSYCFDPWKLIDDCGRLQGELSRSEEHKITVGICYRECFADYAPVLVTECNVQEQCAPGTIIESFSVQVEEGEPEPITSHPELCDNVFGAVSGTGIGKYAIIATVDVGGRPVDVAVAHNGKRALVLNQEPSPTLQVIDVETNTLLTTFPDAAVLPFGGVSVAPDGGPAFVTSGAGITVVDLEAEPPKILGRFLQETPYGPCVAALGGQALFAINLNTQHVDRIEFANHAAPVPAQIDTGNRPFKLALSADNRWLYAFDILDNLLTRIDVANNGIVSSVSTSPTPETIAIRVTSQGAIAYLASDNSLRTVDVSDAVIDRPFPFNAKDSGFTTDNQRYYIINFDVNSRTYEFVAFMAEGWQELARLRLDRQPTSLAIVPGQLRAYVTQVDSGLVSVIDVLKVDRRRALCEELSGPCPTPEKPCVTLAVVKLSKDGMLDEIDSCGFRPIIYSNSTLLEMILCLAECCSQDTTATKTLLYISGDNQEADPDTTVPEPLIVRVLQNGRPINGEDVIFEVRAGNGQVGRSDEPLNTTVTIKSVSNPSGDGFATLDVWKLGITPSQMNRVVARLASGEAGEITFFATTRADLPKVKAIWPPNGEQLDLTDWNALADSGVNITFTHKMNGNQLIHPDAWLGLWLIGPEGENAQVLRVELKVEGTVPLPDSNDVFYRITGVQSIPTTESHLGSPPYPRSFLLIIRSEQNHIVDDQQIMLDADFYGTALQFGATGLWPDDLNATLAESLWGMLPNSQRMFQKRILNDLSVAGTTPSLPSGNGTPGGLFHSCWFTEPPRNTTTGEIQPS